MSKRRKKHNPQKRRQRIAAAGFRHLAAIYVSGEQYAKLFDVRTLSRVSVYAEIDAALKTLHFDWACFLAVFCRDQSGTEYMKSEAVIAKHCLYLNLVDTLVEQHQALIDGCSPLHYVGFGWISSPAGVDFTEARAAEIFTRFDAWGPREADGTKVAA